MNAFSDGLYLSMRSRQALARSIEDTLLLRSRAEALFSDRPARSCDTTETGLQRSATGALIPTARKLLRLHEWFLCTCSSLTKSRTLGAFRPENVNRWSGCLTDWCSPAPRAVTTPSARGNPQAGASRPQGVGCSTC